MHKAWREIRVALQLQLQHMQERAYLYRGTYARDTIATAVAAAPTITA